MDSVNYDETRYLNAHIDFKTKVNGGPFIQHLSQLPGYQNGIYKSNTHSDGVIHFQSGETKSFKVLIKDANENTSELNFEVESDGVETHINKPSDNNFEPNSINVFENETLSFYLPDNAIYDHFHFSLNELKSSTGQNFYRLQNDYTPVQCYFPIKIKGNFNLSDSGKIVMKQNTYNKERFQKASFENGWYKSAYRDFGTYQLLLDKTPPTLTPLYGFRDGANVSRSNKIVFNATDNTKPIGEFNGYIDGQWILFTNDKELSFIYNIDKYCPPGEHILKIVVKDLVGNTTVKEYHFTR